MKDHKGTDLFFQPNYMLCSTDETIPDLCLDLQSIPNKHQTTNNKTQEQKD